MFSLSKVYLLYIWLSPPRGLEIIHSEITIQRWADKHNIEKVDACTD